MTEREAINCFELIKCGLSLKKEVSEKMINLAITALEKQMDSKGKEVTWQRMIERMKRNTYEIEQEMLDPTDRSVAMDEMIPLVSQSFMLGLLYSIAEGNTIILPPE